MLEAGFAAVVAPFSKGGYAAVQTAKRYDAQHANLKILD
jgi:hypothetical protein